VQSCALLGQKMGTCKDANYNLLAS